MSSRTTALIRNAEPADAEAILGLIALLDHPMDAESVAERMIALQALGIPQLVATEHGKVIGFCGLHRMTVIYRPKPVGRITILVVDAHVRGRGIGRALVGAAKDIMRDQGCGLLEITSNNRLKDAHGFYSQLGFDQTSKRFALKLD